MSERKGIVLIVEDHEIIAEFTKINFVALGCEVDVALDGKMAIEYATQKCYDLIMMDIGLPDIDGYQVTEAIRKSGLHNNASVPIIALSAHKTNEELERCIQSGMHGVIIKPLLQEKTRSLVSNYIWLREYLDA